MDTHQAGPALAQPALPESPLAYQEPHCHDNQTEVLKTRLVQRTGPDQPLPDRRLPGIRQSIAAFSLCPCQRAHPHRAHSAHSGRLQIVTAHPDILTYKFSITHTTNGTVQPNMEFSCRHETNRCAPTPNSSAFMLAQSATCSAELSIRHSFIYEIDPRNKRDALAALTTETRAIQPACSRCIISRLLIIGLTVP